MRESMLLVFARDMIPKQSGIKSAAEVSVPRNSLPFIEAAYIPSNSRKCSVEQDRDGLLPNEKGALLLPTAKPMMRSLQGVIAK